jgi:hypothetical protein
MKFLILLLFSLIILTANSQRNYRLGIGYTAGISTFYSTKTDGDNQLLNSNYALKMNQGASVKFEFDLSNRWGLFCQTGFQQRGVRFKNYLDSYAPRYRLNYWDVQFGAQFLIYKSTSNNVVYTSLGISQHTLLSCNRIYDTGKEDIRDEFSNFDVGAIIAIGYQIPVFQNHVIQLQASANFGFKQVYNDLFKQNGLIGKNTLFNIQISFLF